MLNAIRTAAANWLGRLVLTVIMGILIVSFAIWGIGDIFRGGVNRTVATVGSTTISAEEIRTQFSSELERLQRQLRRQITAEDARAFGLDRELLNRTIDEAALDETARKLGLALDPAIVARSIMEMPEFRTSGMFDRSKLNSVLQQARMSEQSFMKKQANLLLRLQIGSGMTGGLEAPEALSLALHQYRNEARDLDLVIVPADKVAAPAEPDETALKAFLEAHKAEFRTVETRKVTLIRSVPTDFAAGLSLSDADFRAYYDRQVPTGRFGTPEKRQIQRVLFETEADAKAAAEKLAGGMSFEALLTERKLAEKDVDFGTLARGEIRDRAMAEAAFALDQGKVSAPLKDPFGWVLVRVARIELSRVQPFELVRAGLEAEVRAEKLRTDPVIKTKLDTLFRKIEDQRIAGKGLAEAAQTAGTTTVILPALDRQGRDGAGKRVEVPGGADVLNAIFASDIGLDNEPVQTADGGHVWYEINAIEPARDRSFEEARSEIREKAIADLRNKALAAFVADHVKRLEQGAPLATIAQELGLPVQRIAGVKRNTQDAVLGRNGVDRAFAGIIGKVVSAVGPDGASRLLILPASATMLPYDAAADQQSGFARRLSQGISEDMLAQYTAARRKTLGVSINQPLFNQAVGAQAN
ncbi:MAG: SurA N-terminal domain-containing protein [Proteobacteria bacterium]|nr:SurA N-terminal domain-containing protein [Pseudomonadota bacterium]